MHPKKTSKSKSARNQTEFINGVQVFTKEYIAEAIVDTKFDNKDQTEKYLIKWKGFGHNQNTWEPACHIDSSHHELLLKTYEKKIDKLTTLQKLQKQKQKLDLFDDDEINKYRDFANQKIKQLETEIADEEARAIPLSNNNPSKQPKPKNQRKKSQSTLLNEHGEDPIAQVIPKMKRVSNKLNTKMDFEDSVDEFEEALRGKSAKRKPKNAKRPIDETTENEGSFDNGDRIEKLV